MLLQKPNTTVFLDTSNPADINRLRSLGWVKVDPEQAKAAVADALPPVMPDPAKLVAKAKAEAKAKADAEAKAKADAGAKEGE